jgi:hypothetical protein
MISQALADDKFTQADPNTNAQESYGRTLQMLSKQDIAQVLRKYSIIATRWRSSVMSNL